MAEKEQTSPIALAPSRADDMEAAASPDGGSGTTERRRKSKRMKCWFYIFLFAAFQAGIILLFTFTVMKIRTPKLRMESATLQNFNVTNASFSLTMNAELGVKNSNFGRFKFRETPVYFYYRGVQVAEVAAAKGRVNWRSTKKFPVVVDVNVAGSADVERDLGMGVVQLSSGAKMRGNVRVAMVLKKKTSADMNCTMEIVTAAPQIRSIDCY